jgi:hypothetical protein
MDLFLVDYLIGHPGALCPSGMRRVSQSRGVGDTVARAGCFPAIQLEAQPGGKPDSPTMEEGHGGRLVGHVCHGDHRENDVQQEQQAHGGSPLDGRGSAQLVLDAPAILGILGIAGVFHRFFDGEPSSKGVTLAVASIASHKLGV